MLHVKVSGRTSLLHFTCSILHAGPGFSGGINERAPAGWQMRWLDNYGITAMPGPAPAAFPQRL